MDSVWWLFLVCAVVLCTVMAGATDALLEQGRINQLSVCLSVCLSACTYICMCVFMHATYVCVREIKAI